MTHYYYLYTHTVFISYITSDGPLMQYLMTLRLSGVNERRSETSSSQIYPIHSTTLHPVMVLVMMAVEVVMMS